MSNFDDLCVELNKDPEFVAEYERQKPYYDALVKDIKMHKPILHIYQDGDQFFATLPEFVDLQESEVVWLDNKTIQKVYEELCVQFRNRMAKMSSAERKAAFQRARQNIEQVDRWGRVEFVTKEDWGE